MTRRTDSVAWNGWPLVGYSALVVLLLTAAILGVRGVGELGWRSVIRATAQTSLLLFLSAFTAAALARRHPSATTRWLLRNRRYLGVSFAVSHTVHLLAIIALARAAGPAFRADPFTVVFGGLAYVFIIAMTATSFDRTAAWLGPRRWQRLHTSGVYYIWFIFALQYGVLATRSPVYLPLAAAVFGALALRVRARWSAPAAVDSSAAVQ